MSQEALVIPFFKPSKLSKKSKGTDNPKFPLRLVTHMTEPTCATAHLDPEVIIVTTQPTPTGPIIRSHPLGTYVRKKSLEVHSKNQTKGDHQMHAKMCWDKLYHKFATNFINLDKEEHLTA